MNWIIYVGLILLVLILVIIITKLKVTISYLHAQNNDSLKMEFKIWFGLIKYKMDIPLIKLDENSPTIIAKKNVQTETTQKTGKNSTIQISADEVLASIKNWKVLLQHVVSLHRIVRYVLKKIKVTQFEWHTIIGAGDAALTGMLAGTLWTGKGSLVALISNYFQLINPPNLIVQPHFQHGILQTSVKCMLQFRIGHAMLAGIKLVKFWKGGLPHFNKPGQSENKTKTSLTEEEVNHV